MDKNGEIQTGTRLEKRDHLCLIHFDSTCLVDDKHGIEIQFSRKSALHDNIATLCWAFMIDIAT